MLKFLLWLTLGLSWSSGSFAWSTTGSVAGPRLLAHHHHDFNGINNEQPPFVHSCDVLVLGAGAAGIAAARTCQEQGLHTIVLEARDRVGGRAHTSDELGVGVGLDHGAKWIHGASSENRIVQLLLEEDTAMTLQRVPLLLASSDNDDDMVECVFPSDNESETCDDVAEMDPSKSTIRILLSNKDQEIESKEPSSLATEMAKDIFDTIMEVLEDPEDALDNLQTDENGGDVSDLEDVSLYEVLLQIVAKRSTKDDFDGPVKANGGDEFWKLSPHLLHKLESPPPATVTAEAPTTAPTVATTLVPIGTYDEVDWIELNSDVRAAAEVLGYDDNSWDNDLAVLVDEMDWVQLSPEAQEAAMDLGYDQEAWDKDSKKRQEPQTLHQHHRRELQESFSTRAKRHDFLQEIEALVNLEICQFLDNWEGAPINEISASNGLEGTILGGGNALASAGYGGLIRKLAEPLMEQNCMCLEHQILSINTRESSEDAACVQVQCQAGNNPNKLFQAPTCIVALPLGVLKESMKGDSGIEFEPPLPDSLSTSIDNLGIAIMDKVELAFPYRWWPQAMERFTIACSHLDQGPWYHPWTSFIVEEASGDKSILVCYLHGEFAKDTERKTNSQIQEECMEVLRSANLADHDYCDSIPDPSALHVTRWFQDPNARGSWTFFAAGSSPEDATNFRVNAECHQRGLYFAGEHTCDGSLPGLDLGCVHGAWLSGELAAASVIENQRMGSSHSSCQQNRKNDGSKQF